MPISIAIIFVHLLIALTVCGDARSIEFPPYDCAMPFIPPPPIERDEPYLPDKPNEVPAHDDDDDVVRNKLETRPTTEKPAVSHPIRRPHTESPPYAVPNDDIADMQAETIETTVEPPPTTIDMDDNNSNNTEF